MFIYGKRSTLQVDNTICRAIKKEFTKDGNSRTSTTAERAVRFVVLLIIGFFMLKMVPENYNKISFCFVFVSFWSFTIFYGFYAVINRYMEQKKWDVVSYNDEMNKSVRIDTYFEKRNKLIPILSTMAKYELFIAKSNRLTDKPSNILKELEKNKELQIHSALIRATSFYKDLIRENGAGFSRLFSEEMERHLSEMSDSNLIDAMACLSILEQCEAVVGKIEETDGMDGHAFEYWCAELLKKNGFTDVEVTKGSGDQGVDVIAVKDGIRYAIQCKCYSSNLGNGPIQEVHAGKALYHCQVGVVMTNQYFTAGAKQLAEATGVLLWDRDKLEELLGTVSTD